MPNHNDMSVGMCERLCRNDGSAYTFIIVNKAACSCSTETDPIEPHPQNANAVCNLPCYGDESQICGGGDDYISIYRLLDLGGE